MRNTSQKKDFDSIFDSLSKDKNSFQNQSASQDPNSYANHSNTELNKENNNISSWSQNNFNTPARNQSLPTFNSNASRMTVNNKSSLDRAFCLLTPVNNSLSQTLNSQNSLKNSGIPFASGLPKIQHFLEEFSQTETFSERDDLENSNWTINSETDFKAATMRPIKTSQPENNSHNSSFCPNDTFLNSEEISFQNSRMKSININPDKLLQAHKLFNQD